jgi:small subunit ribosomal protein S6
LTLYEGMFLLDSAEVAHDWDALKQHVTEMVTRCGGEILYTERWPDRKLAYEIKGRRKGTYLLTYFRGDGGIISPLRREANLSERVLRALILKNDAALQEIERHKEAQQRGTILAPAEGGAPVAPPGPLEPGIARDEFGPSDAVAGHAGPAVAAVKAAVVDEEPGAEKDAVVGEEE